MPLIKLNIRLVLRRLKKISSIKLSAIAASLEKEVEIVVGLCVKSVCGTPHPSAGPTPSPQCEDEIASALTHSGLCRAGQIVFHLLIIDQNIQKCVR